MSVAMAVAFPSSGGRPVSVGVLIGPTAEAAMRALARVPGVEPRTLDEAGGLRALREGAVDLVVVPSDPPSTASIRAARRAGWPGCSWTRG